MIIFQSEVDIANVIQQDDWMMGILQAAQTLNLPDWWIGAGFVRSKVWDMLHGFSIRTPIDDIDVVFFDPKDTREETEKRYDARLAQLNPSVKWSTKNMARMYQVNNDPAYKNTVDGFSHWPEIPTCIGATLHGEIVTVAAPLGIDDLVSLRVTANPNTSRNPQLFLERMQKKQWQKTWPNLTIVYPSV